MNTLKKPRFLIIAALTTALGLASLSIQAEPKMEMRIQRMSQQLNLSESQQTQLRQIMEAQKEQRRAMREKMKSEVDAILTDEQRATRKQMMAERKANRAEHEGMRGQCQKGHGHKGHDRQLQDNAQEQS